MARIPTVLFAASAALWLGGHYCGHRAGLLFDGKSGTGSLEAAQIWLNGQTALLGAGLLSGLAACIWIKQLDRLERLGAAIVFFCAYGIAAVIAPFVFQAA